MRSGHKQPNASAGPMHSTSMRRWTEAQTGWSIRKFIRTARRCRTIEVQAGQHTITAANPLPTTSAKPSTPSTVPTSAANLFFQLVSARYERASLIVTSNKPFGRWGEVFGDEVVAAAMIDRLVHHAEVISLKGDSYRLKDRDLGRIPAQANDE
jgi:hypothetical protein